MFVDIALIGFAFFLSIPLVNGYFAHCYGRSFWLWFILGTFFPIIAHIALAILCLPRGRKDKQLKEAYESLSRYEDEYMQERIDAVLAPRNKYLR